MSFGLPLEYFSQSMAHHHTYVKANFSLQVCWISPKAYGDLIREGCERWLSIA